MRFAAILTGVSPLGAHQDAIAHPVRRINYHSISRLQSAENFSVQVVTPTQDDRSQLRPVGSQG